MTNFYTFIHCLDYIIFNILLKLIQINFEFFNFNLSLYLYFIEKSKFACGKNIVISTFETWKLQITITLNFSRQFLPS